MTFEELWAAILARNPTMSVGEFVRMPRDQFRRALQMAYELGEKAGKEHKSMPFPGFGADALNDLFGGLSGRKG